MVTSTPRSRIGVMGGTFDPIHAGHLIVASEAAHALNLSKVLFVPAASPWQKNPETDANDRFEMVQRAVATDERFQASDVDLKRGGNTYTVDTLRDIAEGFPDAELFLLLGSDAYEGLPSWKEPERVRQLAHMVVLARPGYSPLTGAEQLGAVTFLTVPAIDISSTDCRNRVRYGRPVQHMVTDPVFDYINEHNLYRRSV